MNFFDEDFDNADKLFEDDLDIEQEIVEEVAEQRNIYQEHGYADRDEYLHSLARDFEMPFDVISSVASLYGPGEDFDGLLNEIEDLSVLYTYNTTDDDKESATELITSLINRYSDIDDADDDF